MQVDYSSHVVRLALRTYFLAGFLILAIIGKECCKTLAKSDLYHGKHVQLHRMTGWISDFTFFTSSWDLRNISGSIFMGLVMLMATILAPVADLAVGGLVQNIQVPARCDFGQCLVLAPSGPFQLTGPPINGRPKTVAANTQVTSIANSGLQGIYLKANSETSFHAEAQDVLAGWLYTNINDEINYGNDVDLDRVMKDLVNRGYLYTNKHSISLGILVGYEHFVAWSSSSAAQGVTWDVKASIDISALPTNPMVMRCFHYTVSNHATDGILSSMDSSWTLNDWLQDFQGGYYSGSNTSANNEAGTFIEQYLNSMLMVQAGSNNLLQTPKLGEDATQGCLVTKANIPYVIFVIVGILGLLLLAAFLSWVTLLTSLAFHTSRRKVTKQSGKTANEGVVDYIPYGLTSWMLHAARESALRQVIGAPTRTKMLEKWRYMVVGELDDGGRRVASLVNLERSGFEGERLRPDPLLS